MKVRHGNIIGDAWRISKVSREGWVNKGFKDEKIYWHKNNPDILCVLQPWSISMGKVGDYLILQNNEYFIVSVKKFIKDYLPLDI